MTVGLCVLIAKKKLKGSREVLMYTRTRVSSSG
jgi:hypothetical protein